MDLAILRGPGDGLGRGAVVTGTCSLEVVSLPFRELDLCEQLEDELSGNEPIEQVKNRVRRLVRDELEI